MKLYAVRIFVRDWPAACKFYGTVLGLPERFRDDGLGWAEYDVGGRASVWNGSRLETRTAKN